MKLSFASLLLTISLIFMLVISDSVMKAVSDLDRKKIGQLEEQLLTTQHENSKLKVCMTVIYHGVKT